MTELRVSTENGVITVTLERPESRNAVTPTLLQQLADVLENADSDPDRRVIVLRGAGGAFCAGYDLAHLTSPGTTSAGRERDEVERVCGRLARLDTPTIAAVAGAALGAGCDLAVSCDLRVAAADARFGMPPARLGILYSREGVGRLSALVGPAVAKELLFTGEPVDAATALAVGLVNRVVPVEEFDAEVLRLATTVAANAPLSVRATKRLVRGVSAEEGEALGELVWSSDDAREGPNAVRERRAPRFHGR